LVSEDGDYSRWTQVVCQTDRGLEVGEVLATLDHPTSQAAGRVVRALTRDDDSHLSILRVRRDSAFRACQQELKRSRITSTLIDAEPLFDGKSLYFYFADQVPPQGEPLRLRLARAYRTEVVFRSIQRQHAAFSGLGESCEEAGPCGSCGCGSAGGAADELADEPADVEVATSAVRSAVRSAVPRQQCGTLEGCSICAVSDQCGRRRRLYPDLQPQGSTAR
jgi:hypothetical protein